MTAPMKETVPPKMTVLVTGASGFVAQYIIKELLATGHSVVASDIKPDAFLPDNIPFIKADLTRRDDIFSLVKSAAANACIHLGAVTSIPASKQNPQLCMQVNVVGTLTILDAFRECCAGARILVTSSSHVYGVTGSENLIDETAPLRPQSLYAISKAAADLSALQYHKDFGASVMTTRSGNHTGPGQSLHFVAAALADQVADIKRGKSGNKIFVGNLDSLRDFTDVRDVVRAYRMVLESGTPGQSYNVSSGTLISIKQVLEILCEKAIITPEIIVDPEKYRPFDSAPRLSTAKIRHDTGWKAEIPLPQTLSDLLADLS